MKLQKLVYFAHGWYLALTGEPLIAEKMEAWQYGPVIPQLYRQLKAYGDRAVTEAIAEPRMFNSASLDLPMNDGALTARQVIARVWTLYGVFTAVRLSNATHLPGSPWFQAYDENCRSTVISNDTIRSYFIGLAKEADGARRAS